MSSADDGSSHEKKAAVEVATQALSGGQRPARGGSRSAAGPLVGWYATGQQSPPGRHAAVGASWTNRRSESTCALGRTLPSLSANCAARARSMPHATLKSPTTTRRPGPQGSGCRQPAAPGRGATTAADPEMPEDLRPSRCAWSASASAIQFCIPEWRTSRCGRRPAKRNQPSHRRRGRGQALRTRRIGLREASACADPIATHPLIRGVEMPKILYAAARHNEVWR